MEYDVAVIGSGPGGYVAAIRAAQLGMKVAIIEMGALGGTCLNVGCIPSKTLLYSTELYAKLRHEGKINGIEYNTLSVDFKQMMLRKSQVVKSLVDGVALLMKKHKITKYEGKGRLKSPTEIEITRENKSSIITSNSIILATGSEPIPLPFLPFDEKRIVSSTGALSLSSIPKKLLIVGAGVIGVELASVYNRLGAEVTVIEMLDHICPTVDLTLSRSLLSSLKKQGIVFFLSTKVNQAKIGNEGVSLFVQYEGNDNILVGDVVLVAVGRRPYSQGLGLKEMGIRQTEKGFVVVDGNFRTSISNIYAIGDLIEGPMLAHRAFEEAAATAEIIAGQTARVNYNAIPNVIYTHPEVAVVGLSESEARGAGLEIKIGNFPFKANARARCSGESEGNVKVISEVKSNRIIGMHIIGPSASELIAEGVIAIEKRATLEDVATSCYAHPTLSEAVKEATLDALGRTIHI
jgi:dihydrolipoamide dehydrogenase